MRNYYELPGSLSMSCTVHGAVGNVCLNDGVCICLVQLSA